MPQGVSRHSKKETQTFERLWSNAWNARQILHPAKGTNAPPMLQNRRSLDRSDPGQDSKILDRRGVDVDPKRRSTTTRRAGERRVTLQGIERRGPDAGDSTQLCKRAKQAVLVSVFHDACRKRRPDSRKT